MVLESDVGLFPAYAIPRGDADRPFALRIYVCVMSKFVGPTGESFRSSACCIVAQLSWHDQYSHSLS